MYPGAHLVRAMLAGGYLAVMMAVIWIVGGQLSVAAPGAVKLVMGLCFAATLNLVLFAGAELFTGSNLVITLGALAGRTTPRRLLSNWSLTWLGNLAGAVAIALAIVFSGVLDAEPVHGFVLKMVEGKMALPAHQLFLRAVLANWMVCVGVWCFWRMKTEIGKLVMVSFCMFIFVASGYEHAIANMSALLFGLLLPHAGHAGITPAGYGHNLLWTTLGNVVGGAGFVAGAYWLASPPQSKAVPAKVVELPERELRAVR